MRTFSEGVAPGGAPSASFRPRGVAMSAGADPSQARRYPLFPV